PYRHIRPVLGGQWSSGYSMSSTPPLKSLANGMPGEALCLYLRNAAGCGYQLNSCWRCERQTVTESRDIRSKEKPMKVIAALALGLVLFTAAPALAHDVDGKWAGTVSTPMGDFPVAYEFKADGATLTGSTTGPDGGQIAIK